MRKWHLRGHRIALRLFDRLPWNMAEACCAALSIVGTLVRPGHMRKALAWADGHPRSRQARWLLALTLASWRGRFFARHELLGLRSPGALLQETRLIGEEHLPREGRALLVGFHLGGTAVGPALAAAGHLDMVVEIDRYSRSWSNDAWRRVRTATDAFALDTAPSAAGGVLYRARRRLLEGGRVFILADGGFGRTAFTVPVPGSSDHVVRAGWLMLRRQSCAPVIPVLAHRDRRTQIIVLHPPLPPPLGDADRDAVLCREVLLALFGDFVARFPEQCSGLVFDV